MEKVLERQPDLVLAALGQEQNVNSLEKRGIDVLVMEPVTVADVLEKIRLVGRVTGEAETAASVTEDLNKRIMSLADKVPHLPEHEKPKVFYELWHEPLTTAGADTFIDDLIKLAGGINVAAGIKKKYPEYSLESLLAENPDVLIHTYKHGGGDPSREEIRTRKGWQNLNFVKNDRIYAVDADLVNRPGPRLVDGLENSARAVHPEIFGK